MSVTCFRAADVSRASTRLSVAPARKLRTVCTSLISLRISFIDFLSSTIVSRSSLAAVLAVSCRDRSSLLLAMAGRLDSIMRLISTLMLIIMSSRARDKAWLICSCDFFSIFFFVSLMCSVSLEHSCTRIPATSCWYLTKWPPSCCSAVSRARTRLSILSKALLSTGSSILTINVLSLTLSTSFFGGSFALLSSIFCQSLKT
mmetsp:Transcript_37684/g.70476  ORF Transcript_37684/g.70476 Transcript_37684/m.70476 type:complete len:202 (+) Transcript_37684:839-1444(+)